MTDPPPFDRLPADEAIIAMREHKGRLFVATSRRMFRLDYDGTGFEPLRFVECRDKPEQGDVR